jgi:hypothetical protein
MNRTEITGDRTRHVLTFNPNSEKPGEEIYVNIPKLKADSVLVPDSMALVFDFKNSNTKSWFRNNLGKLLQKRLEIRLAGEKVYDNSGESLLEVYKDLWLHNKQRDDMVEGGIASEATRKKYPKTTPQTMTQRLPHCSVYSEQNRKSGSTKSSKIMDFMPHTTWHTTYNM